MNRKIRLILFMLMLVLIFTFVITSCDKGEEPQKTEDRTPTPTVNRTPTPTPAPTPTVAPTAKPLSDDQKGKPQVDAVEIFKDEFKGNEKNEQALYRGSVQVEFITEEQLKLSHDGNDYIDNWGTYTPDIFCTVGELHNQYEFYVDLQTSFKDDSRWMACFIGARTQEASGDSSIPTNPESGFFVAITKTQATIYPGTDGQWAGGKASINLPETADTMHTFLVIDDGKCLYYYMVLSSGEKHLLLKADVSGDETIVTDKDGNEIVKCANSIKENKGGYFKLFNHMGYTTIDNVILKGSR